MPPKSYDRQVRELYLEVLQIFIRSSRGPRQEVLFPEELMLYYTDEELDSAIIKARAIFNSNGNLPTVKLSLVDQAKVDRFVAKKFKPLKCGRTCLH